jgi:hypothetical protein
MSRTQVTLDVGRVDVYPVGILKDLLAIRVAVDPRSVRRLGIRPVVPPPGWRRRTVAARARSIRRGWRRGSAWNGYLAEPEDSNSGAWMRCGHGWTTHRAVSDLARHLVDRQRDDRR